MLPKREMVFTPILSKDHIWTHWWVIKHMLPINLIEFAVSPSRKTTPRSQRGWINTQQVIYNTYPPVERFLVHFGGCNMLPSPASRLRKQSGVFGSQEWIISERTKQQTQSKLTSPLSWANWKLFVIHFSCHGVCYNPDHMRSKVWRPGHPALLDTSRE